MVVPLPNVLIPPLNVQEQQDPHGPLRIRHPPCPPHALSFDPHHSLESKKQNKKNITMYTLFGPFFHDGVAGIISSGRGGVCTTHN